MRCRDEGQAVRSQYRPPRERHHELGGGSRAHAIVFGLRLDVRLTGRAGELARLGDEEHAVIVETLAAWFRDAGWVTEAEASFSEWGERGRIDLLAFDARSGTLVIVEAKTLLLDLQDLLGAIGVKERLAMTLAQRRGWTMKHRLTLLAVASTTANRKIVRAHPSLFADFAKRNPSMTSFPDGADRTLQWVSPVRSRRGAWIAGRQRVRLPSQPQLSPNAAFDATGAEIDPPMEVPLMG